MEEEDVVCFGKNGETYRLQNMFKTVRELLGEDSSEQELKIFMRSELFRGVLPDLYEAFNSMERRVLEEQSANTSKSCVVVKEEKPDKAEEADDESDLEKDRKKSEESKHKKKSHHHHKHKHRDREPHHSKHEPPQSREHKGKSDDNSSSSKAIQSRKHEDGDDSDHEKHGSKRKPEESMQKKKSHHHHHNQHNHNHQVAHHSKQQPPPPIQIHEPKGKSYYNASSAKAIEHGKWKPYEDNEFSKNERPFRLGGVSILALDLVHLNNIFHHPSKGHSSKSNGTIPLKTNMIIPDRKADEIERQERRKRNSFEPVLQKMYAKNVKNRLPSFNTKRKGQQSIKDQRQKGLEQLREKTEQKNSMTRKLPWENKKFFDAKKTNKPPAADKKDSNNPKTSKAAVLSKKIPKIHAPGTSMQAILQQITSANVEAANKPKVELKIPKLSNTPYTYKRQPAQKSVTGGLVATEVDKLLRSNTTVQCPAMTAVPSDLAEYTIRKIGWWFLKEEQDPPDDGLYHPELHDNEIYEDWYDPDDHIDDDDISIGCVSDPEGTDEPVLPVGRKPEKPDADKLDEYAGLATLEFRIPKITTDVKPGKSIDWVRFLKTKPGTAYEKSNFEAKCYICDGEVVKGRRQLGAHIRSDHHKDAFRNYSLKLAKYEERALKVPVKKVFVAKLIQYTTEDNAAVPITIDITNDPLSKSLSPRAEDENDILVPDSPRAVIDSDHGSPTPVAELVRLQDVDEVLSLPSLALYDLEQDNEQLRAKICLRTNGLWTKEMEDRWLSMQERETRMTDQYNEKREQYISAPDSHPLKNEEWIKFWERRCSEVEAEGKNPDEMDFGKEWVPFWLKRVQEVMKADIEAKMLNMKQELGLDATTLIERCRRHGLSPDVVQMACKQPQSSASGGKVDQSLPPQPNMSQGMDKRTQDGGQPIQVLGASYSTRPPDGQRVIQLMNKFASIDTSIPPPHMATGPAKPANFNSHYNNTDQKNLKDNYRDDHRGKFSRDRGRGRNDRKRGYMRSPPPKQLDNNRRPSNDEKYHKQTHSSKASASPESDWETEPQQKLAKASAPLTSMPAGNNNNPAANQYSDNYNSARAPSHPNNRLTSYDARSKQKHSTAKVSSPESDWETEAQSNLTKPSGYSASTSNTVNNSTAFNQYGNYNPAPIQNHPNNRRTSYDDKRPKQVFSTSRPNASSSPDSDWEAESKQTVAKSPVYHTSTSNYNSASRHRENRRTSSDEKYPKQRGSENKISSPESDWEKKLVAIPSKSSSHPSPAPVASPANASHKPDLKSAWTELQEVMTLVDPIISPPEMSTDVTLGLTSTLDPILSDDEDNQNDVPYSPVSVLSLDNDPCRGVSPINSIEMSVEMMPVEEESVDNVGDTPTLEKSPEEQCGKVYDDINPSSPEDGEIDSPPPSSIDLDQNNVSSFIEPFNQIPAKQGKSPFCAAVAAAEMDKNSLGYQLYVKNRSRKDSANHRSSNKETSGSKKSHSKKRQDRSCDEDARNDNPWL